jgi:hypothetical protein
MTAPSGRLNAMSHLDLYRTIHNSYFFLNIVYLNYCFWDIRLKRFKSRFFYKIVNGSFQNSFAANCGALNERISIQNGKFIFKKRRFSNQYQYSSHDNGEMVGSLWEELVVTKFEFEFI